MHLHIYQIIIILISAYMIYQATKNYMQGKKRSDIIQVFNQDICVGRDGNCGRFS